MDVQNPELHWSKVLVEQRQAVRKVLKVKAVLTIEGMPAAQVRTVDIGSSGMAVASPRPITLGHPCQIQFELCYEGKVTLINAKARVAYCIFSNNDFKVGLHFLNLDLTAMTVLAKFLR